MNGQNYIVSIIIVTYNSLPSLSNSLSSLQKADTIDDCELIVIDNNSSDESVKTVKEYFPNAHIIQNKENIGFARACNQGASQAIGEFLLFYNPDLEIDKSAIASLIDFFQQNQQAGAVAGRMRFPDGSFQATCRKFPDMTNIFLSRGSMFSKFISTEKTYTLPDYETATEVDAVAGTFLAVRRSVFEEVSGFDERFFMYMEDTDFSLRVRQAGYKNYFLPQAGGVHLWGKGSSSGYVIRSYYHHLSVWKYYLKHFPGGFSIISLPILLCINFFLSIFLPKR